LEELAYFLVDVLAQDGMILQGKGALLAANAQFTIPLTCL
jgi:hypothetical protein